MLFGTNDVCDLKVVIINNRRQVIETRTIGTLDYVILLSRPIKFDITADEIVQLAPSFSRHF